MGVLRLSAKERKRLELLSRVREGVLKLVEAAGLCLVSYRQMKQVWKRYREEGDAGLVHRGRTQLSNRRLPGTVREQVLQRYA